MSGKIFGNIIVSFKEKMFKKTKDGENCGKHHLAVG